MLAPNMIAAGIGSGPFLPNTMVWIGVEGMNVFDGFSAIQCFGRFTLHKPDGGGSCLVAVSHRIGNRNQAAPIITIPSVCNGFGKLDIFLVWRVPGHSPQFHISAPLQELF